MNNVYILISNNCFKIGVSKDIKNRIKSIQTGNPHEVRYVTSMKCKSNKEAYLIEKKIHKLLDSENSRMKGEWFDIDIIELYKIIFMFDFNENKYLTFLLLISHMDKYEKLQDKFIDYQMKVDSYI